MVRRGYFPAARQVTTPQRLHRDLDAVYNAIELLWSNGQAEGQINRLKTIKRTMYGRAGPELLRARVLPHDQNRYHTK
ncbi:transposase [Sinorhizobium meliloti]|nr:transposase [Sinorhizobium meliloti]